MSIFHEPEQVNRIHVVCSSNERRGFEKRSVFFIHPLFNGATEWMTKTHLVCRYDGEPFDSIPIPLPVGFDCDTNTYTCYGVFCSASCVKAYMENNVTFSNALSMIWLKKLMCEVFGDFGDIVESPPIDLLQKHGGELTIEQFRKFGKQMTRIITHRMPFFTCALAFELVKDFGHQNQLTPVSVPPVTDTLRKAKKLHRNTKKTHPTPPTPPNQDPSQDSQTNSNADLPAKHTDDSLIRDQLAEQQQDLPIETEPAPGDESTDGTDRADFNALLPNSITLVSANVGNRWEIRGLKRPEKPVEVPIQTQTTKSMFQEYLEQKKNESKTPGQVSTQASNSEEDPHKRRGRPKSTRVRPESPKIAPQGTLVSFLKTPKAT